MGLEQMTELDSRGPVSRRSFARLAGIVGAAGVLTAACSSNNAANAIETATEVKDTMAQVTSNGVLRVGTTGDFPPISVKKQDGSYEGLDIEFCQKLASDLHVDLQFVDTDWKNLVAGLDAKRYDVTTSVSVTAERLRSANFTSTCYRTLCVALVQKADAEKYASWDAINTADTRVAAVVGTLYADIIGKLAPDSEQRLIDAPGTAYQAVISKQADVGLTSNVEAAGAIAANPDLVVSGAPSIPVGDMSLAVSLHDQAWFNYINRWVGAQVTLGYIDELLTKYNVV